MNSKKYLVTHKLERDVENLTIPNVTISREIGMVELSPSGVKIAADSLDRLSSLRSAATIAVTYASEWRNLVLTTETAFEDGKQILTTGTIHIEFSKVGTRIDTETYQNTMNTLLAVDSDCLPFLMRAFELQGHMNELAILNAMFGLDLQLSRIVPQHQFWNWGAKIALLEFLQLLSSDSVKRLRTLGKLRDVLAHGDWTNQSVGNRLNDLLEGGRDKWLVNRTRVSTDATRLVIGQILLAFGDLARSRVPLDALVKQIKSNAATHPTKVDNEKEGH